MKFILKSLIIILSLGIFNLYGSDKDKKAKAAPKAESKVTAGSSSSSSSLPKPKQFKKIDASKLIKAVNKGEIDKPTAIINLITQIVEQGESTKIKDSLKSSLSTSSSSSSPSPSSPQPEEEKKESAKKAKKKKKKKKTGSSTQIRTKELIDAIHEGDFEKVKDALENGANPNAIDNKGDTVLIIACIEKKANRKIVALLLEHGAKIDGKNDKGNMALTETSKFSGYNDIIEILLEYGADIHAQNDQALMNACEFGNADLVELLLEKNANVTIKDDYGNTPLMNVCREEGLRNSYEVVKLLLEKGADVNIRNIYGETVLMSLIQDRDAAYYESDLLRTAKLLIDFGLDVNAEDNDDNTALSLADEDDLTEIYNLLKYETEKIKSINDNFINAMLNNNEKEAYELAKSTKINPNYKDKKGSTALIIATKRGYSEIVKTLLKKGADIKSVDKSGRTALNWAQNKKHYEIVKLLLERCASCSKPYDKDDLKNLPCACNIVYCKDKTCIGEFKNHIENCSKYKKAKRVTPSSPSSLPSTETTTIEDKIEDERKTEKEEDTPSSPSSLPSTKTTTPSTTVEDKIKVEDKESKEPVKTETVQDKQEGKTEKKEEWQVVLKKPKKEISDKRKRILTHKLVTGSTGRTKPNDKDEETAMKQVMENPENGKIIRIDLNDKRWHKDHGWNKMAQVITINSKRIKIHYVANKNGKYADFKFKDTKSV